MTVEAAQLTQLRDLLAAVEDGNPFYRERLRGAGLSRPLESLDEFIEKIPFTTKAELAADQQAHPPYGTNLTYPPERYLRLHQTSSTTGKPLRWLDTPESWSWMLDGWCEVLRGAEVTAADRVFLAFSFGPFIGLWMGFEAAQRLGCLVFPGGAMNSIQRLKAVLANEITVLCCTPTYAIRLGEVARAEGLDTSRSSVRAIIVGGEPGASVPATRAIIGSAWPNARVFDHYGMTEVGPVTFQCTAEDGHVHVLERSYLAEIVDPESGRPRPANSMEMGELVLTPLGRTGSPVLRYRTGDIVRRGPSECGCGRSGLTFAGGIIGRADDMVVVRGVNLYPTAVDQIIRGQPAVAEYRVEVGTEQGMTELNVLVEPESACPDAEGLCRTLEKAFRDTYNLRIPVTAVPAGHLPRFELKARRWEARMTPLAKKINGLLYPLDDFYAGADRPLPVIETVNGETMPQPYRRLLVHERDMTSTLEAFAGSPLHLKLLQKNLNGGSLFRHVALVADADERPLEYGAIRIELERFPEDVRAKILEAHRPLGAILNTHGIVYRCSTGGFFRIESDATTGDVFGVEHGVGLYGRHAMLHDGDGTLLAEVVEILPPLPPGESPMASEPSS